MNNVNEQTCNIEIERSLGEFAYVCAVMNILIVNKI